MTKGCACGNAKSGCRDRPSRVLCRDREFYVATEIAYPMSQPEFLSRDRVGFRTGASRSRHKVPCRY